MLPYFYLISVNSNCSTSSRKHGSGEDLPRNPGHIQGSVSQTGGTELEKGLRGKAKGLCTVSRLLCKINLFNIIQDPTAKISAAFEATCHIY